MIVNRTPIIVSLTYYDRFLHCHKKRAFSITPETMTPEHLS